MTQKKIIGLCGAHRTGKTTVAKAAAQQKRIPFLQTSSSEVFKKLGISPQADLSLKHRLAVQLEILEAAEAVYQASEARTAITDRTPVDMLAYTMADFTRENSTPETSQLFEKYKARCIETINRHFSTLVLVQPGIKIEHDSSKAPSTPEYIDHIAMLARGIIMDDAFNCRKVIMPKKTLSLSGRVHMLERIVELTKRGEPQFESAVDR